jgi:hypothetical protein
MRTIQSYIDDIRLPLEDKSLHPQRAISLPNMLVYRFFMMVKNAVIFNQQETKLKAGIRETIDQYFLDCVHMCEVDLNECPCLPPVGCTWMKSEKHLPEFLGDQLKQITLPDGTNFDFINWGDLSMFSGSRKSFISSGNIYSIKDRAGKKSLYVLHGEGAKPKTLSVEGPFTNPLDLVKYETCDEKTICKFLDQEFFLDPKYQESVVQRCIQLLAGLLNITLATDVKSDDKDASQTVNPL